MKKEIFEWIILAVVFLAALTSICVVFQVSGILDTTLIAGIIAFFGAIIGGILTLVGVRITINNSRLGLIRTELRQEVMKLYQLERKLNKLIYDTNFDRFENHMDTFTIVKQLISETDLKSDIYLFSLETPEVYSLIIKLENKLVFTAEQYFFEGYIEEMRDEEVFSDIIHNIEIILYEVKKRTKFIEAELNIH